MQAPNHFAAGFSISGTWTLVWKFESLKAFPFCNQIMNERVPRNAVLINEGWNKKMLRNVERNGILKVEGKLERSSYRSFWNLEHRSALRPKQIAKSER